MDKNTTAASSAGELVAAEIISRLVIDAAYSEAVMPSLVRGADISGEDTNSVNFPGGTIEVNKVAIKITITDMLLNSAGIGGLEPYADELGKALANKIDSDILAEISGFHNSVGRTGYRMTEVFFLEAISTLENGNAKGPYACILHPVQVRDLRDELRTMTGAVWGGASAPAEDLGAFASLYGVDVFRSTNCPLLNCGTERQGVMMPIGNQSGLAYVLKTGARTEFQRVKDNRATEIIVNASYGKGCVDMNASGGVAIISKSEEDCSTAKIGNGVLLGDNKGSIAFEEL